MCLKLLDSLTFSNKSSTFNEVGDFFCFYLLFINVSENNNLKKIYIKNE